MDINGCYCVSTLDARGEEGFATIISRTKSVSTTDDKGNVTISEVKIERGPFFQMQAVLVYAHSWKDVDNPPPMPTEEKPADDSKAKEQAASTPQSQEASANDKSVSDPAKTGTSETK